jgi:hypothetical protein
MAGGTRELQYVYCLSYGSLPHAHTLRQIVGGKHAVFPPLCEPSSFLNRKKRVTVQYQANARIRQSNKDRPFFEFLLLWIGK